MRNLEIGKRITGMRKAKGTTQSILAEELNVLAAAISKWESDKAYPDIELLPKIAKIFNITIDELMGYKKNELNDDEVMELYKECEEIMANGEVGESLIMIEKYIEEYPNNYFLKFRMGFLIYIYSWKTEDEEERATERAIELFEEVVEGTDNEEVKRAAMYQLGALYPSIGKDDEAINILKKMKMNDGIDPEGILGSIYIRNNRMEEGREIFQRRLYKAIEEIKFSCMGMAQSYKNTRGNNVELGGRYFSLLGDIINSIDMSANNLFGMVFIRIMMVQEYMEADYMEKAMDEMRKILEVIKVHDINEIENISSIWCFDHMKMGDRTLTCNMNENLISILDDKVFDSIRNEMEFRLVYEKTKERI